MVTAQSMGVPTDDSSAADKIGHFGHGVSSNTVRMFEVSFTHQSMGNHPRRAAARRTDRNGSWEVLPSCESG